MSPLWRAAAAAGRRLGRPPSTAATTFTPGRRTYYSSSAGTDGMDGLLVFSGVFFLGCVMYRNFEDKMSSIRKEMSGIREEMKMLKDSNDELLKRDRTRK